MRAAIMLRAGGLSLLAACLACTAGKPTARESLARDSIRGSSNPTSTWLQLPACPDSRRWVEFVSEEPPVRFEAPVLSESFGHMNELRLKRGDWSGTAFQTGGGCRIGEWQFAGERLGGASRDWSEATERQICFNHRWFERDGKVLITQGGGRRLVYRVRPLDILDVDGGRAVLYRASSMRPFFLEGDPRDRHDELVAVVNFPRGYHDVFASLTIHLIQRATVDDLRRAVRSVRFRRR